MPESPTGNGYVQGSPSYREDDARREIEEMLRSRENRRVCTCKGSPFGMDVDRCPVHGEGCA